MKWTHPPCKVGDILYRPDLWVHKYCVKRVTWDGTMWQISALNTYSAGGDIREFLDTDIGKNVFLTESEAEQALKEMTK